jgi:isocitrate dehydrogenase (NAD+)
MMMEHLGEGEMAAEIERAVREVLKSGEGRTADMGGAAGTRDVVAALLSRLT